MDNVGVESHWGFVGNAIGVREKSGCPSSMAKDLSSSGGVEGSLRLKGQ